MTPARKKRGIAAWLAGLIRSEAIEVSLEQASATDPACSKRSARSPWLELRCRNETPLGAWIELTYRASLYDRLVRPLLRFESADSSVDVPMPAALFGRATWIGKIPADTLRILVSPMQGGGQFGFEIEDCRTISIGELFARAFVRNPLASIAAVALLLRGRFEVAGDYLRYSVLCRPLGRYGQWRENGSRQLDARGLERSRAGSDALHIRIVLLAHSAISSAAATTLLRSLEQQHHSRWSLVVACPCPLSLDGWPPQIRDRTRQLPLDAPIADLVGEITEPFILGVMKPGDQLPHYAFDVLVHHAVTNVDDIFYADEDEVDRHGRFINPKLKPDWSPIFEASSGYTGSAIYYRNSVLSRLRHLPVSALDSERQFFGSALSSAPTTVSHLRRITVSRKHGTQPTPLGKAAGFSGAALRRDQPGSQSMPYATIIIPTRDKSALLRRCIGSLNITLRSHFEVIIVDNDSVEDATRVLFDEMRKDARFRIVKVSGRFNFATSCNRAAKMANSPLLVFLNNDALVLDKDWLDNLASWASLQEVAAVGVKLLYPSGKIQHGGVAIGIGGHSGHIDRGVSQRMPSYLGRANHPREVSAITGACLAIQKEKFDFVEGFDEARFFVDLNDIDLCLRLAAVGWKNVFTPEPTLVHLESASRGTMGNYDYEERNFRARWHEVIRDDPYFHPALSVMSERTMLS